MLHAPLPEGAQMDGEVRLCLEADLHPDGSYGQEWMVVTEAQVLVFGNNGAGLQRRFTLPLSEISEPKAANFIGGGAFELLHDEQTAGTHPLYQWLYAQFRHRRRISGQMGERRGGGDPG